MMRFLPFAGISVVLLAACGDPAPGEGVEQAHGAETMPEVVSAAEAIQSPHVPAIDLLSMHEAEYEKIVPDQHQCVFRYTSEGRPVLAAAIRDGHAVAAVKIHGKLVELVAENTTSFDALTSGATFSAEGTQVRVTPGDDAPFESREGHLQREAEAVFELEQGLKAGYRGWYACESTGEPTQPS